MIDVYEQFMTAVVESADPNLVADDPAATIYTEKPLDLARQARFLMDWDKYHPIVKIA